MFALRSSALMLTLLVAAPALAEGTIPAATVGPKVVTAAEVTANGVDDQAVVLQGYLIANLDNERYTFKDSSGTLTVEIDNDDYPIEPISTSQLVHLTGHVDKDLVPPSLEVEVDSVRLVQ